MSQNSLTLPTTGTVSGLQMTQDMNNAIDTLNTLSSGASAPGSPEAGQLWHDTTNNILKLRSDDNTSWIALFYLNQSSYLAGPPSLGQIGGASNRLLNGGMAIDQMNEGASYSISTSNVPSYTADQWVVACESGSASGVAAQCVTDAPAGFTHSLKLTIGTGASSVAAGDFLTVSQPVEANNVNDLNFGSSGAVRLSLSFWVKSSVTGTFAATLQNAAATRSLVSTFSITAANTWTLITLANIAGDSGGTWVADGAAQALALIITVATGSTYQTSTLGAWVGTNSIAASSQTNTALLTSGATFQLTGVMLNAGAFCQPFEKRTFQDELYLLQRYFEKSYDVGVIPGTASNTSGNVGIEAYGASIHMNITITPKRTEPTIIVYSTNSGASGKIYDVNGAADLAAIAAYLGQKAFGIENFGVSTTGGHLYLGHWTANARM